MLSDKPIVCQAASSQLCSLHSRQNLLLLTSRRVVDTQMGHTRAALALIGMVAAQRPDTLRHNLDTLLQASTALSCMMSAKAVQSLCSLSALR